MKHIKHDIIEHVAMPHPTDLLGPQGVRNLPVDPIFTDKAGRPDPIRASEERVEIGSLNFLAGDAPLNRPVDEIRMTGLNNKNKVLEQIERVRASEPSRFHIILVSQMAYAALRLAKIPTQITESNPVGFGIPADIARDRVGNIKYAARIDQPQQKTLPTWNNAAIASRREKLLQARDYEVRSQNLTPTDLRFGSVYMHRPVIAQPDYDDSKIIGKTQEGVPIVVPRLKHLLGDSHEANAQFVHPRALPIARQLGREDLVARSFMVSSERNKNGSFSNKVGRLAVFHAQTLDILAREAA